MQEIICPLCEEVNAIYLNDFEFEPVDMRGSKVRTRTECQCCNGLLVLTLTLSNDYGQ